jgi:two-component system sensor histidine kinase/response regulator
LGLAIASRLVVLMGGRLTIDSAPGKGSCFEFSIECNVRSLEPLVSPSVLAGKRIAITDSNDCCRKAISRVLEFAGAEITAENEARIVIGSGDFPENVFGIALLARGNRAAGRSVPTAVLRKPVSARELVKACLACAENAYVLAPEATNRSQSSRNPTVDPTGVTILLAEDNRVNQMLARRTLEKSGYRIVVANNGVEAVRMAEGHDVDLVLMDIQMPEMDGFEATTCILAGRRAAGLEPLPIIAITAHALKGDRERCLTRGMADYLSKPIRPSQLLEMVEKYALKTTARL